MPWRASSVMEERLRFVARLLDGEATSDVCREFGISRNTGYKIFDRYKEHGLEALSDRKSTSIVAYGTNMPLRSFTHMAQRHTPLQLAADLGAAVLDTSITLWWRWPIFLAAGTTSRDGAELNRMVSEKVAAATSGTVAAQTEAMRIASRALTGKKTPHAATAVVAAALKPALRTVKANAKRLGKKRRSAVRRQK